MGQAIKPNILLILVDGMQAEAIDPSHPCQTPNLDALADRGVTFTNAHTTCPTCSPARASLMTGLLPHNHGVLEVEHGRDDDQCVLRTQFPHFAQHLGDAGYKTGYFGKWHIERSHDISRFGWQEGAVKGAAHVKGIGKGEQGPKNFELDESLSGYVEGPRGYRRILHWGVTDTPITDRYPGITVKQVEQYLDHRLTGADPWCCCASFSEPNEALVVGRETWNAYEDVDIPLPANFMDDMSDRPNLYQREQQIGQRLTEADWRNARRAYYGRITELDAAVGQILARIEQADQLDDTVVIFVSDHGRYVGSHGYDAHNFGAFEEIYRIPLIIAGPGIAESPQTSAQVSIADLAPTICELAGAEPIDVPDSQSFAKLLGEPDRASPDFGTGYAEYHGTRFSLAQRILWQDGWKFVFNGFDFDELYNLTDDPHETRNLISHADQQQRVESMMTGIWRRVRETNDRAILESHYFSMRFACVGPDAADRSEL